MRAGEAPSTRALRGWQRRALVRYLTTKPRDFLLVATHHRTGKPHGWIHNELRRICGGPPVAAASSAQPQARIEAVRGLTA